MLAIKYQPNIFLNSVYVPSIFNKIFSTLKWVCRETCSVFLGTRVQHLFILFLTYIFTSYYETSTRKILDPQNTHEKNIGPMEYPREKILYPRRQNDTMTRDSRDPQWHEIHRI